MSNETKQIPEESLTGSDIGSQHWYNTILSHHKHIGEFLRSGQIPESHILKSWGERLYNQSDQMIRNYGALPENNPYKTACESINKDNPMAVAENLPAMIKAIETAAIMLRHHPELYQPTVDSLNALLTKIQSK